MAKKSTIAKEKRKEKTVNRLRDKLAAIKQRIKKSDDFETRMEAIAELQKLPRNASKSRLTTRCRKKNCGRPRAVYKKFGLCRIHLREFLMNGEVTGGRKSSW